MKEAMFYKKLADHKVKCVLCAHRCEIVSGKRGICRVRENQEGVLYSLNYQRLIAEHIDPIEKKPLFHFYPGSQSYSIAAIGCNFRCLHCQNWSISQVRKDIIEGEKVSPERVVQAALHSGCSSISYTYTEPTIYFETAFEISRLAQQKGLKNVFVTNGYLSSEALHYIAPYLDAANIDLKAMSDKFYREICGARLEPVLECIRQYYELGIWIEITTLIIPGYNDKEEELAQIAQFIADIDRGIPWHVTAFYPTYQLYNASPTPLSTLKRAYQIGKEKGLYYVYQGNVG
ncbi:MAG: AmmeMemoRadiSam system radical SAM enzyme, partial [Candidatus Atribacteria bacterium]|nr:AmmeMemoRadiSam system radical SAM enzyme [Candidatus Atribacteria bacterium]